jgi:hypothetical protein
MITITKEQLYQLYLRKKEDLSKQLQKDTEKIHLEVMRQNELGKLSVTIACQPKNIKELENSQYSLDNKIKLPTNLVYIDNEIILNLK